jgi:hypothetical protein
MRMPHGLHEHGLPGAPVKRPNPIAELVDRWRDRANGLRERRKVTTRVYARDALIAQALTLESVASELESYLIEQG